MSAHTIVVARCEGKVGDSGANGCKMDHDAYSGGPSHRCSGKSEDGEHVIRKRYRARKVRQMRVVKGGRGGRSGSLGGTENHQHAERSPRHRDDRKEGKHRCALMVSRNARTPRFRVGETVRVTHNVSDEI